MTKGKDTEAEARGTPGNEQMPELLAEPPGGAGL
jgi:hypothetical protein